MEKWLSMRGLTIEETGQNAFLLLVGSAGKNYWVVALPEEIF